MSEKLPIGTRPNLTLHVYALGCVDFDALLAFQRRLQYEISEERTHAALILCEHPSLISVGRRGSRSHIRLEADELHLRGWPIRWVNRGGGCILHGPGQLALYPILPLDHLQLGIAQYLHTINLALADLLGEFSLHADIATSETGVRIGPRLVAALGVTVRNWITGYGAYLNVYPPLGHYADVATDLETGLPMTSLERERKGRVRPALVRQRLIEHFQARFGFERCVFFSDHPALPGPRESQSATKKVLT
jgi:lipoyl(octanoyl) transferase